MRLSSSQFLPTFALALTLLGPSVHASISSAVSSSGRSAIFGNVWDCRALATDRLDHCDFSECRSVIRGRSDHCESADCRAIIEKREPLCESADCRAILLGNADVCESKRCQAVVRGDSTFCDWDRW
jgi:hypothetical protein